MTDNAVLRLRAERLARATRPFLARGNRIRRCQRCLLPLKQCLCATLTSAQAASRFCLVMFDTEPMKPSNTGRLIADILPDTEAFQWSRTEPPQALLDLVAHPDYQPMVVFPASYAGPERQVLSAPPSGKPPLFIMLDGTWTELQRKREEGMRNALSEGIITQLPDTKAGTGLPAEVSIIRTTTQTAPTPQPITI